MAELRRAGLPVSVTEEADAAEAIGHLPLEDRQAIKFALGATLVKSANHWRAFDTAFEVYFSMRGPQFSVERGRRAPATTRRDGPGRGSGRGQGPSDLAPAAASPSRPRRSPPCSTRRFATATRPCWPPSPASPSARYAGMEPGRPVGGTYYLYRTLRNLDLDGVLARLVGRGTGRWRAAPVPATATAAPDGPVLRGAARRS